MNKLCIINFIHNLFTITKYIMNNAGKPLTGPSKIRLDIQDLKSLLRQLKIMVPGHRHILYINKIVKELDESVSSIDSNFKKEISKSVRCNDALENYIFSMTTSYFVVFRRNFCYWLLACCKLGIFDVIVNDNVILYHTKISSRSCSGIKSLASLAPEALNLYINSLNGLDESNQINEVKNLYNELMQNPKILRSKSKKSRMYLKSCLNADQFVTSADYSDFFLQLEYVRLRMENLMASI